MSFFTCRGADGAQVIYWYHRQFIETAQNRYLNDEAFKKKCHKDLAEYFMGKWASEYTKFTGLNIKSIRKILKKLKFDTSLRNWNKQILNFANG